MNERPANHLYLVKLATEEVLAIRPLDGIHTLKQITVEAQLRAEANVYDPESGLVIRDSATRPLPAEYLARVWRLVRWR